MMDRLTRGRARIFGPMRRAVAYVRKSTPQEGDALRSVARQEEGARAYCREHGLDLVRVYADEAISGLRVPKARPAFARMMQDAEAGGFEVVLCYDLDRLGRNARRMAESLYRLLDLGVKVIDFTQGTAVDLTSSAGRLTLSFRLELAQGEAERARQRARDAHEARAKRGWVCGLLRMATGTSALVIMSSGASMSPRPRSCARSSSSSPPARACGTS
jgi:site-specific DNA recombinase